MLNPQIFTEQLQKAGYGFFTGVPDSLLKELCACISDTMPADRHVITANEGAAVALAAGHYLSTGTPAVVYMQNSGTGNAINPLLSLADPAVYAVPMLLVIGWRAEPGVPDEPQHVKQGAIQTRLMETLGYPCEVLSKDESEAHTQLAALTERMLKGETPVALLVRKGTFDSWAPVESKEPCPYALSREEVLRVVLESLPEEARIVSTTGKTSREIYELRVARGEDHSRDFLTVGSMGHALMIASGVASGYAGPVYCIDGDGAALMHLGSMAVAASRQQKNLKHILVNNGAHESVGGQPTVGFGLSFEQLATVCGYTYGETATTHDELAAGLAALARHDGPAFLEVRVAPGSRGDLGRPKTTPVQNRTAFMEAL